jgi:hypothetical protein
LNQLHPMAPHDLPFFISKSGETDVLMIAMGILIIVAVLAVGNLYLRLHSLPERMAHKSQKLQFEIVAVLGLLALFTHIHLFWIGALLLAMIDLPDFGTPLRSIAGSVEKIANTTEAKLTEERLTEANAVEAVAGPQKNEPSISKQPALASIEEARSHA